MQATKVGIADREVTIGMLVRGKEVAVTWAVHRLDAVLLIVDLHEKHIVVEGVVVPRSLPQVSLIDKRGDDLRVAVTTIQALYVLNEEIVNDGTFRMEEWRAWCNRVEREEV